MRLDARIYVAGDSGLVGSAIKRELIRLGYQNILTRSHGELDLTEPEEVKKFFRAYCPQYVFLAAAKVGGIMANRSFPADFIRENLAIQANVIESAHDVAVSRLLFLGSSCIYPKMAPQPICESALLTGPLESTNRPYALAKIAGVEMCWAFNRQYGTKYVAAMPTNLYGPGDNYDLANSHVLPALIRKAAEAKARSEAELLVWGTGTPRREFLHSSDLARACVFLLNLSDDRLNGLFGEDSAPLINIGTGSDVTIAELAAIVARVVGFEGQLRFDASKPDGTPRKLMDSSKIHQLGWQHEIGLEEGIRQTWEGVRRTLLTS